MTKYDAETEQTVPRAVMQPLTAAFLAHAPTELTGAIGDLGSLEQLLTSRVSDARAAWPEIDVPDGAFIQYLVERLEPGVDPRGQIEAIHVEDLYLASAYAAGRPKAMVQLDRRFLSNLAEAVRRSVKVSDDMLDDVLQAVRQKLLMADGSRRARLLDYAGRGPLSAWIRSAAIRTALNLLEQQRPGVPIDEAWLEQLPDGALDPELKALKSRCRAELKSAFEQALAGLEEKRRDLLRMNILEGMSIDRIAEILKTPRSTVARRLQEARDNLAEATRALLSEQLGLTGRDLNSLLRVVRSQLDLSLYRCLK